MSVYPDRDGDEDPESAVARTGHAQSVSPAGGAGSLRHDPDREPEFVWLLLWSYCKLFICPLIIPQYNLYDEMTDS